MRIKRLVRRGWHLGLMRYWPIKWGWAKAARRLRRLMIYRVGVDLEHWYYVELFQELIGETNLLNFPKRKDK